MDASTQRKFGELSQLVLQIKENTECLPELCKQVAVQANQIKTLQENSEKLSNRTWAVITGLVIMAAGLFWKLVIGGK